MSNSDASPVLAARRSVDMDDPSPSVDLVGMVRRNLGSFVLITVVVGALTAAGALLTMALPPVDRTVSIDLTLTFPKVEAGTYPNGAPFRANDLVAAPVVDAVWKAQGLEAAVALDRLMRNLQVVPGGTDADLLQAEFGQKLANSKLTVAERAALEQQFRAELAAANAASLRISGSCTGSGVQAEQLGALLVALPAEWSRLQDSLGANAPDSPVPSAQDLRASASLLAGSPSVVDAVFAIERARDALELLASTGDSIAKRDGSAAVRGPDGGSVADLKQEIAAVRRNLLVPALVQALRAARASDPSSYRAMRSARLAVLESDVLRASESARIWRESFQALVGESKLRGPAIPAGSSSVAGQSPDIQASLDSSFLDRVIKQAIEGSDLPYRRTVMEQVTDAELDLAALTSRQHFERWLDAEVEAEVAVPTPPGAASSLSTQALLLRVAGLAERMSGTLAALGARDLNPASRMYRLAAPPQQREVRVVERRTVLLAGAAAWLASLGIAAVVFVARERRAAERTALLGLRQLPAEHLVAGAVAGLQDRREHDQRRISQSQREPVG